MSERGYFFDGVLIGDAAIAPYDSAEFSTALRSLIGGERANYGVIDGTGDGVNPPLAVLVSSPASKVVHLQIGAALVNGRLYINSADLPLTVQDNASGQPRIDMLVIRRDTVAQTARAVIKQGTPAASPVAPAMQQDATTWEIPIATINVSNGFTIIVQQDVGQQGTLINGNSADYVDDVLNVSGGTLHTGDIVVWDFSSGSDRRATTSTTRNNRLTAGVWVGETANNARGRVQKRGFGWAKVGPNGALGGSIGDGVISGAVAAAGSLAKYYFADPMYAVGRVLEAISGGTNPVRYLTYIDVMPQPAIYAIYKEAASAPGGFTSGAWRTRAITSGGVPPVNNDPPGITFNSGANSFAIAIGHALRVRWGAPAYKVGTHQTRLNLSGTTFDGSPEDSGTAVQTWSQGDRVITDSGAGSTMTLEHQCTTTNGTDGRGLAPLFGESAGAYAFIEIWRGWS